MLALTSAADSVYPGLWCQGLAPPRRMPSTFFLEFFSQSWLGSPGGVSALDPSSRDVDSGGYGIQGHPWLPREFEIAWATSANGLVI